MTSDKPDPLADTWPDGQRRGTAPPAAVDFPGAIWIPANRRLWRARAAEDAPRFVCLHSTENRIAEGVARSVARWFCTAPPDCKGCAHYVVGLDEIVQCVREKDQAGAAGKTANRFGIHIELVGQAETTDWSSGPGLAVLQRTAPVVRSILDRNGWPIRALDASRLEAGESGIVTHATCTAVWHESCHRDPGLQDDTRWPWELFLSLVSGENLAAW
jgi:hypothetical protein